MKTLTAEDAKALGSGWILELYQQQIAAIASGAHEVHDRATHRAVSVETLRFIRSRVVVDHASTCDRRKDPLLKCTCGLTAALAEIEEKLRDA